MAQNRGFELLERLARLEAELVGESGPCVAVGGERLGLAPGAVESQHQQPAQVLAQRLFADQRFEFGDGLAVAAECEVGFEAVFECDEAEFLESVDFVSGPVFIAELCEWGAAPECEGVIEERLRSVGMAVAEEGAGVSDLVLEAVRRRGRPLGVGAGNRRVVSRSVRRRGVRVAARRRPGLFSALWQVAGRPRVRRSGFRSGRGRRGAGAAARAALAVWRPRSEPHPARSRRSAGRGSETPPLKVSRVGACPPNPVCGRLTAALPG